MEQNQNEARFFNQIGAASFSKPLQGAGIEGFGPYSKSINV